MTKVEIKTVYVSESRLDEIKKATQGSGVTVLPIGQKVELVPGIEIYTLPDTDTGIDLTSYQMDKVKYEGVDFKAEKVYLSEEHKNNSEQD